MSLRRSLCALALGASLLAVSAASRATVVERVVAVVGEQAILLSELRERARPFLARVDQQSPDSAQRAAATSQLYGQLVDRMVDEELEQRAANRANLSVTPREVDDALGRVASQNGVPPDRVVEEAVRSGLTEQAYRTELRRQLLEAKLMNLRIQGRLRVTDEDVRAAYARLLTDERRQLGFRAAWIRIAAPRDLGADALRARRAAAEGVVAALRRGEDFALLAARHSIDPAARSTGGLLGTLRPGSLPAALDAVALSLEAGGISEPVRHGDDFVILKLVGRDPSRLPRLEEAKDEIGQRVYMEKMGKARRHWLDGLRRQTHVEVRL